MKKNLRNLILLFMRSNLEHKGDKSERLILNMKEEMKLGLLKIAGYLIPLVQSLPTLGIWTSFMTLPFASYLIILFSNLPEHLPRVIMEFLIPFPVLEKIVITTGLLILIYSITHLRMKRKRGLVISGPYNWIRHPQYLGFILITLGLTSWSVWILNNTFGMGFLSPMQTIGLWFIELLAYIILAYIEERHLSEEYGERLHLTLLPLSPNEIKGIESIREASQLLFRGGSLSS